MAFLVSIFGAEETSRKVTTDGLIMHAEMRMGDSMLNISDARAPYQPTQSTLADRDRRLLPLCALDLGEQRRLPQHLF